MKENKKKSFFSWLNSKILKKTTITEHKTDEKTKTENYSVTCHNKSNKIEKQNNVQVKICNVNINSDASSHMIKQQEEVFKKNACCSVSVNNARKNFFLKLQNNLKKTRTMLGDSIINLFISKKIDDSLFEELEERLLLADIGVQTTENIIQKLINDMNRKELKNSKKVYDLLKKNMYFLLKKVELTLNISRCKPFIILVVGVNGSGKTTTVIKLAKKYKIAGKSVLLAAADTFRAAGIEQLKILGQLNEIPVISQYTGADPAAVIFDAVKSAISKKVDVLIIDTAGRLHNKLHLMEELKKIVRVIKKLDPFAPHETMLIVDACNGQNTIQQTKMFHQALNLTGITITKLDGTAKGGVLFSIADQFAIPIRYIGIGEKTNTKHTQHTSFSCSI